MRGRNVEKAKDFKGTLKKLLQYISTYKYLILIVILFAVGSTIFAILGPNILGDATTLLFEGLMNKISGTGGIDYSAIAKVLMTLFGIYLVIHLSSGE